MLIEDEHFDLDMIVANAGLPSSVDQATHVILEHGLHFIRPPGKSWYSHGPGGSVSKMGPTQVIRETGLRPVVLWTVDDRGGYASFVLSTEFDADDLDSRPACISQIFGATGPTLFPAWRFRYFILSIVYRVRLIAALYAYSACHAGASESKAVSLIPCRFLGLAFEIDAFFSTMLRLIDSMKRPLWKRFGSANKMPETWPELINSLPVGYGIRKSIKAAVEPAGKLSGDLRKYRQYIEHYEPALGRHPWMAVIHFPGVGHGVSLWLPDDPDERESRVSRDKRIDALSYCWRASVAITKVTCDLLRLLGDSSTIPHPDEDDFPCE